MTLHLLAPASSLNGIIHQLVLVGIYFGLFLFVVYYLPYYAKYSNFVAAVVMSIGFGISVAGLASDALEPRYGVYLLFALGFAAGSIGGLLCTFRFYLLRR
jgi:hypothetical protein